MYMFNNILNYKINVSIYVLIIALIQSINCKNVYGILHFCWKNKNERCILFIHHNIMSSFQLHKVNSWFQLLLHSTCSWLHSSCSVPSRMLTSWSRCLSSSTSCVSSWSVTTSSLSCLLCNSDWVWWSSWVCCSDFSFLSNRDSSSWLRASWTCGGVYLWVYLTE